MTKPQKILGEKAYQIACGSSYSGVNIQGAQLKDLLDSIGTPSNLGSGDDKVQAQWVFQLGKDRCMTIYDWKNYNKSLNFVDDWHIGSKNLKTEEITEALSQLFPDGKVEWFLERDYLRT